MRTFAISLMFLTALIAIPAEAQRPQGGEIQVNTYTTGNQQRPAVAMSEAGDFVVVWQSGVSAGDDNDGRSIQGQLYDSSGQPIAAQFQVNTTTTSYQSRPAVAMDLVGNFVVAWTSYSSAGDDADGYSVQAQRFFFNGNPNGSEFQVNTFTTGYQAYPSVAIDSLGDFVIVWDSGASDGDTDGYSVHGRRFKSDGNADGDQFQVNTYTTGGQFSPTVAFDSSRDFIVTWDSFGSAGSDSDSASVQAQRFFSNGMPNGTQFQVNTYTAGFQGIPHLAINSQDDLVIVWQSDSSGGTDDNLDSVQGQRFDSAGQTVGGQFQVNSLTSGNQSAPRVALDNDGNATIVWESAASGGNDDSDLSVQMRVMRPFGASPPQFQVNSSTSANQLSAAIARNPGGAFAVVWDSGDSAGTDSDNASIQLQRFEDDVHLFTDGFESGDTSRWSGES